MRSNKVNDVSNAPAPIDVFMAENAQDDGTHATAPAAPQQIGAFVSHVPRLHGASD